MFSDDLRFFKGVYDYVSSVIPRNGMNYGGNAFTNLAALLYNSTSASVRSAVPGMNVIQNIDDTQRYWSDYQKNTGKSPRYPGVQIHSRDLGDAAQIAQSMDWWLR